VLVYGYRMYRELAAKAGEDPWPLTCCGTGPLAHLLEEQPGIENLGFVQPDAMRQQMTRAGVFVLPSRYDPWPLAIVEACAAGLPVIATEACGSTVELVRPEYNGFLIPTGDAQALADAMLRAHQQLDRLPEYGIRANQFAAAYSAQVWADRMMAIFEEVVKSGE
jgi:glycosyltransferase involved in cell wall biosynthesis